MLWYCDLFGFCFFFAFSFPFLSFITTSCVLLVLKQVDLTCFRVTFWTDFTWMEATWASAEEDQTKLGHKIKPWPAAHEEGNELKRRMYTDVFFPAAITPSSGRGKWQSLSVRCSDVKATSEHSDDTLEWLSHVPWIGWIVQADENVSKKQNKTKQTLKMLHKQCCVSKMKTEATCFYWKPTPCILTGTSYCLIQKQ